MSFLEQLIRTRVIDERAWANAVASPQWLEQPLLPGAGITEQLRAHHMARKQVTQLSVTATAGYIVRSGRGLRFELGAN